MSRRADVAIGGRGRAGDGPSRDVDAQRTWGCWRRPPSTAGLPSHRRAAEFAQGDLPDKMHAALIERSLGGRIVGVIARDATEIEAREKPVKTEPNDKKEVPPPPDGAQPTRKRGRPRTTMCKVPIPSAQYALIINSEASHVAFV